MTGNIGKKVIDAIISNGLFHVDDCGVVIWSSGAAEQIEAVLAEQRRDSGPPELVDSYRINWLAERHLTLAAVNEKWGDEIVRFWKVTDGKKSLSGHPEGCIRDAIDKAMVAE